MNIEALMRDWLAAQSELARVLRPPKHIVGLSGGKDSTAMALRLIETEPRDYEFICTPTGNELPVMRAHWEKLERMLGKPLMKLTAGGITLTELIEQMQMLPNFRARWCTRILKIEPTIEYMTNLPPGSVLYVGLRADEEERPGIMGEDMNIDFPMRRWGWGESDVWKYLGEREKSRFQTAATALGATVNGSASGTRFGRNYLTPTRKVLRSNGAWGTRFGRRSATPGRRRSTICVASSRRAVCPVVPKQPCVKRARAASVAYERSNHYRVRHLFGLFSALLVASTSWDDVGRACDLHRVMALHVLEFSGQRDRSLSVVREGRSEGIK